MLFLFVTKHMQCHKAIVGVVQKCHSWMDLASFRKIIFGEIICWCGGVNSKCNGYARPPVGTCTPPPHEKVVNKRFQDAIMLEHLTAYMLQLTHRG